MRASLSRLRAALGFGPVPEKLRTETEHAEQQLADTREARRRAAPDAEQLASRCVEEDKQRGLVELALRQEVQQLRLMKTLAGSAELARLLREERQRTAALEAQRAELQQANESLSQELADERRARRLSTTGSGAE
jgi:hypothetical protein